MWKNHKTRIEVGTIGIPPKPHQLKPPPVPESIVINFSKVCNLWCYHCFYPRLTLKREKILKHRQKTDPRFLSFSIFKQVADEMSSWPKTSVMRSVADGEPLLNPKAIKMIAYAKKRGVRVALTTNGLVIHQKMALDLLKTNVDVIDVSIDAATEETYSKVRRSRSGVSFYSTVEKNIRNLIRLKKEKFPSGETKIMVNMIDQPLAHKEIQLFINKWKRFGADVVLIRPFHSTSNLTLKEGIATNVYTVRRFPCRYPFTRLNVSFDKKGKPIVYYCSHDWEEKTVVGILGKDGSLKDIWQGKKMQEIRRRHLENDFPKNSFCGPCPDWYLGWGKLHQHLVNKLKDKNGN